MDRDLTICWGLELFWAVDRQDSLTDRSLFKIKDQIDCVSVNGKKSESENGSGLVRVFIHLGCKTSSSGRLCLDHDNLGYPRLRGSAM